MGSMATAAPSATPFKASSGRKLRGDYGRMRPDYTLDQDWVAYSADEHARWRFLYRRQAELIRGRATPQFVDCLARLDAADAIPDLERASDILEAATGWRLVAVPGLIPSAPFFAHLAERRFPVTWWLRGADELDYLVEPDLFHDFFGHVPLLSHPAFADYMQRYGELGLKSLDLKAAEVLARLYWYSVEFGLILSDEGLRAFGAGILSSSGETVYALESPKPHRVFFEPKRVLRTKYAIDDYQGIYFVLESFEQLFQAIEGDLLEELRKVKAEPAYPCGELRAEDRVCRLGRPDAA